MKDPLDQLLRQAAQQANDSIDFDGIKASILLQKKRRARLRIARFGSVVAACLVVGIGSLLFLDNASKKSAGQPPMLGIARGDCEISDQALGAPDSASDKYYMAQGAEEEELVFIGETNLDEDQVREDLKKIQPELVVYFFDAEEYQQIPVGNAQWISSQSGWMAYYRYQENALLNVISDSSDGQEVLEYLQKLAQEN